MILERARVHLGGWNGIIVVPKKSGSAQICVDLKPLNKSVQRAVHPIPKVDDILAQMTGAKIFSKLVAFGRSL